VTYYTLIVMIGIFFLLCFKVFIPSQILNFMTDVLWHSFDFFPILVQ